MEPEDEKININYIIGEHPEIKNRVVIAVDGTGIDINNPKHFEDMEVIVKILCTLMYSISHDIPVKNINFDNTTEKLIVDKLNKVLGLL